MGTFVHLAGTVVDFQVVGLVVFDIELEDQVQALCRVCVEVLFQLFKYLSYRHCFTLFGGCLVMVTSQFDFMGTEGACQA